MKTHITMLLSLSLLSGCFDTKAPSSVPPLQLTSFTVGKPIVHSPQAYIGVTITAEHTPLAFLNEGSLTALKVNPGDTVQQGQVLAQQDVIRITQELTELKVQHQLAKQQLQRARSLQQSAMMADSEFDDINSRYQLLDTQLKLLNRRLEQRQLIAPFNGVIASVNKEQGENVNAGETVLALYRIDRTQIDLSLSESQLASIAPTLGQSAQVTAEGATTSFPAKVLLWSEQPTNARGSYLLRLELNEPQPSLLPGTSMQVQLSPQATTANASYLIPSNALVANEQHGDFSVWLYQQGALHQQAVTVSAITQAGAQISAGLQPGDRIITNQLSKLTQQRDFTLINEAAQ
ncbi:efflux RND transporter periplasmic adaptor subunit [Paraferrimonas haliotis]|uniref:Membrane protein n=1 Tax=Paraferrimonas haliotis TaxID=2013866 RepID=A0AA37WY04_9GAMM|nr:efflux RND transporter periplasmic adaptor subunit [Paraferrimonas haliotis]GLS82326.1 membrane protein [Paraferrimonas haliotis]